MLKGEKIILRPIIKTDISLFLKWFNNPELLQYISLYLPMTEIEEEEWIKTIAQNPKNNVIFIIEAIENSNKIPIGDIGLFHINTKDQNCVFGIAIGEKDYWSKGYGTDASKLIIDYGFKQLNLYSISSSAIEYNERSIRLHKKLGFKEEGRRRKRHFKNGQFWDEIIYGLLKEEWNKNENTTISR
jgi:RimJ/RimL family protein N-acetyltransferase